MKGGEKYMDKRLILTGITAVVLAGAVIGTGAAEAYRGDPNVKGPNYSEERHTAMTQAFEKNDYEAWKNLMQGKGRVTQVVNKDNFAKFAQAHKLALEGKTDEANKIRQELGLGLRNGEGKGQGNGYGRCMNR
jgi:hypothetical protein